MARERIISLRNPSNHSSSLETLIQEELRLNDGSTNSDSCIGGGDITSADLGRIESKPFGHSNTSIGSAKTALSSKSRPISRFIEHDQYNNFPSDLKSIPTTDQNHRHHQKKLTSHNRTDDDDNITIVSGVNDDEALLPVNLKMSSLNNQPIVINSFHVQTDTRSPFEDTYKPLKTENPDMGQFMDQVARISIQIDEIGTSIDENQARISSDVEYRTSLINRIQEECIDKLKELQLATRSNKFDEPTHPDHHQGTADEREGLIQEKLPTEDCLKVEQVSSLKSRLKAVISRLRKHLVNERQMISDQIEFEWANQFSNGSAPSGESSSQGLHLTDPYDHHAVTKDAFDESEDVEFPYNLDQVDKRLKEAVRSSTSYPEARQSSLVIKSQFDVIGQIQASLSQLNQLNKNLSDNRIKRSRTRNDPHCEDGDDGDDDDGSSVSMSLEEVMVSEEMNNEVGSQAEWRKKQITFVGKPDSQQNLYSFSRPRDLEDNYTLNRMSRLSTRSSFHSSDRRCTRRYRFTFFCCLLSFVVLGCFAGAVYLVMRRHDN